MAICKLQNFPYESAKILVKIGRNYRCLINGSVKLYGKVTKKPFLVHLKVP